MTTKCRSSKDIHFRNNRKFSTMKSIPKYEEKPSLVDENTNKRINTHLYNRESYINSDSDFGYDSVSSDDSAGSPSKISIAFN